MIRITRSVDFNGDVLWVCRDDDETTRRCRQLYLGKDVNVAISNAIRAGLTPQEATDMAKAELARTDASKPVDTICV